MATLAFPISELTPVIFEATADAKCVVSYSRTAVASFGVAFHIVAKTFQLKRKLSLLATRQEKLLGNLVQRDFSVEPIEELGRVAIQLGDIVAKERELLVQAYTLGSEIRVWWNSSLIRLTDQVEHLDSIAESLSLEAEPEGALLLAVAAEQLVMR